MPNYKVKCTNKECSKAFGTAILIKATLDEIKKVECDVCHKTLTRVPITPTYIFSNILSEKDRRKDLEKRAAADFKKNELDKAIERLRKLDN